MRSLTQRAAHATWWSALEITSRYGVQFAVMVVLARLLTPADFGLIAMLLVFTTVAALLVDSGFGTALVQKQDTSDDDETTVFLFSTGASALVAAALWFAAPAIASFYSQPLLTPLTRLLLFVLPLSALAAVPDALLTQRLDFKSRAKAEIVASLCSGVLAVLLAWRGFGVWSLACQAVSAIGMRALLLWVYSRWRPRGRFNPRAFRSLGGFGGYMLMANLLNTISLRLQSLLIGKLFDSRALGYYTLAQNTQLAPAQFMSGVLNRVGLPVFSTVAGQPEKLVGALRLSLRVAIFVFVPCMVGIAMVARPLIVMLYGARWAPAAPLLSILAISATFWPLHVLNLAAIGAQGRSDLIFKLELAKRLVSIGLIVACSPGGPVSIAWAVLASSLFAVAINTWYSKKLLGYGVLAQLRDQVGTVLLSATAALAGWLVLHWLPAGAVAMIAAIVAAAFAYLAGAVIGRHPALREMLELARTMRPTQAREAALGDESDT
ncbi:MAG TPA: lipopolysaccharide biosynthesis protein [Rhodanobacteraceae bacterium]|nr:lipopolysaccharide biosynthesis protein [Rhodanobacteraceae bacterium]